MEPTARRNSYDFLRLLAALAVVVQHSVRHLDRPFLWLHTDGDWWFYDGVSAFFIISGLFVFRSADRLHGLRNGWRVFYANRALRIMPALYAYLVVTVVLVVLVGAATVPDLVSLSGAAWVLSTVGLVPVYSPGFLDDFGTGVVNGSLWTIPAEVSFYVVVPVLVLVAARSSSRVFVAGLLGAGAVLAGVQVVLGDTLAGKLFDVTFLPYLWFFGLGIGWYYARDRVRLTWPRAVVAAVVYAGCATVRGDVVAPVALVLWLAGGVALSYVVVAVGERGPGMFSAFTRRVGDLSFGTYVWHMVVVNLFLWFGWQETMPEHLAVPAVIAVTLLLAWVSWQLVERRALARKPATSRVSQPGPRAPVPAAHRAA